MGTQPKQRCKSRCVPGTLGWFHGHKDNSGLISKEEFATMCFLPCLFSDVGIWPAMTRRCRSYVHCLGMQDASLESRRSAPGSTTRTLWLRCGIWESRCVCQGFRDLQWARAFRVFKGPRGTVGFPLLVRENFWDRPIFARTSSLTCTFSCSLILHTRIPAKAKPVSCVGLQGE